MYRERPVGGGRGAVVRTARAHELYMRAKAMSRTEVRRPTHPVFVGHGSNVKAFVLCT
jgi:hypothetical protein